jgi:hypothetical protein
VSAKKCTKCKLLNNISIFLFLPQEMASDVELSSKSDSTRVDVKKKISNVSTPSISSISVPSTSGKHPLSASKFKSDQIKLNKIASEPKMHTMHAMGVKKVPPPFKKTHSQSQIQVRPNQSPQFTIENEMKMLKKSKSFDRNNTFEIPRHQHHAAAIDNKKIKTKH